MGNLYKQLFLLIISGIIISCNSNAKTRIAYKQNTTQIKGEFLPLDFLVGSPNDIVCRDNLLIYYDRYERKLLSVIDLNNNQLVGRYISEGNGPGEAIAPLFLLSFPQKDVLYTYQRNMATISLFTLPDFKIKKNLSIHSSTPWRPFEMQRMKDYYAGIGIFDKGRFSIYDPEGKLLQTGGTYPFEGEEMERISAFMLYQGVFCASPENNYLVLGCSLSDHIAFYEIKENEIILLKEYASYDVKARYKGQLFVADECLTHYVRAFGTTAYCYMLYSGETYAKKNQNIHSGNYIIVFDWQGNYVKTLETDHEIKTFYVDETHGLIYATALNNDGEYGIMKFKI
jgi:hypothetical protein